jgi:hypothetical protein
MRLNHGGQASLIDRDGMSRLVTAKHNLMSKKLKCGKLSAAMTHFSVCRDRTPVVGGSHFVT